MPSFGEYPSIVSIYNAHEIIPFFQKEVVIGEIMPRQARIDAPGALHHIICRGLERRNVFRDDEDRRNFLERLGRVLGETSTTCLAWALMPNHFHLLLRTGNLPIAGVMRRLLTGYAVSFNRKHNRHGHLFQNRYKSILCQEESYLLELVRYIHLNPLRAKLVNGLKGLNRFEFCGHAAVMGRTEHEWQDVERVLSQFGRKISSARNGYLEFVENGIVLGKRKDLIGGGLIRSSGGWQAWKDLSREGIHVKSDERILGDSDFVESVLREQGEQFEYRHFLENKGYDLQRILDRVATLFEMEPGMILEPSKKPERVRARSLVCFWAVRDLGLTGSIVGQAMGMTQSAVSKAVERGARLAAEKQLSLEE
jgi:REP element-mobilizing transposase RayT